MPSISTLCPMQIERDVLPVSIRGAIASTVSGSSARRNSSACSENTTPNPQVAPSGFCSNRSICASGATPLPEIREIEAAGASTDDGDTHVFLPIDSILTNLEWRLIRAGNLRYRKMIRERGLAGLFKKKKKKKKKKGPDMPRRFCPRTVVRSAATRRG